MCKSKSASVALSCKSSNPTSTLPDVVGGGFSVKVTESDPLVSDQQKLILISNETTTDAHVVVREVGSIAKIALPMIFTGLLLYSRSMISVLFLSHLGGLALAGGSLAGGFANITGYSILSGLAMGMEPICTQSFGAKRYNLLGLTLQRTILLLILTSLPISLLWANIKSILLLCGQDEAIATQAQSYLCHSIPDLFAQSLLHPSCIYLRTQSITLPLTYCAVFSIILHVPINYFLVTKLGLGVKGVALSGPIESGFQLNILITQITELIISVINPPTVLGQCTLIEGHYFNTNFNLVASLIVYVIISGLYNKTWEPLSTKCVKGWKSLLKLAIPSCISVCLEWWWYEIMIFLCGLLLNPRTTVASMGILIQTTSLIYIFPSSLSFSVSTRVGNELGARRPGKAKLAAIVGLSGSFMMGFVALSFALSVRNIWATMFTQDKEIVALTSAVLPIIGLCELGNCPQTTGCGVLRGTARPKVGANINLGCFYLVGMPVAVGLSFYGGLDFEGMWIGLLAAQASCMVCMLVVLLRLTDWEFEAMRSQQHTNGTVIILNNNNEEPGAKFPEQDCLCVLITSN